MLTPSCGVSMTSLARFIFGAAVAAGFAFSAPVAHAVQAGPDAGDHILTDAMDPDPGGANSLYSYVDITGTGAVLINDSDDAEAFQSFPGGQTFHMYGTEHAGFYVTTNGLISSTSGNQNDTLNDCGLPVVPSSGAGDRIYAVHTDLVTTVYYQYFPTGSGPAGWSGNVSVIQWVGTHFASTDTVDFELLIFHSLDVALLMVDVEDNGGAAGTTGMQNDAATAGIELACNSSYIVPGETMVGFGTLRLNEIRVDEPGNDDNEYFELSGVPGWDASALDLVVIGDGTNGSGEIDDVVTLNGGVFDPFGVGAPFMAIGTSSFNIPNEQVDYTAVGDALNFENDDNLSFFLVEGLGVGTAAGDDLDTNDDGTLDATPWTNVVDSVALIKTTNPPPGAGDEWWYGGTSVGPDGTSAVFHAHRCDDVHGTWVVADADIADDDDSPGRLNVCQDCGNGLVEGTEECDGDGAGTGGETAACNDDCRLSRCGDGNLNTSAGEACDDGNNENTDDCPDGNGGTCQPAACGDGFVDMQGPATEGCDDGNGTNTDDCPDGLGGTCEDATCGDGFLDLQGPGTEGCDDGDGDNTDDCPDGSGGTCEPAACGDGFVDVEGLDTEGCDDGDGDNTDDCPDGVGGTCEPATCGDGFVDGEGLDTEGCDDGDGDNTDDCPDGVGGTCEPATCGDNFVDMEGGVQEDCDTGAVDSVSCDADCTAVLCGDGHINNAASESCDDGNQSNTDDCPDDVANGGTCIAASCGDGFVDQQGTTMETCDGDGAGTPGPTATCDFDCTVAECGDGVTNVLAVEACDDTAESLGCDGDCTLVECGDGELNVTAGEACDDGNTTPGDGCDAVCLEEMGMGGMGGAGGMGAGGMDMGGSDPGVGGSGPGAGVGGSGGSGGNEDDGGELAPKEGGCGCSVPGRRAPIGAPLALLLGVGLFVARRRRR